MDENSDFEQLRTIFSRYLEILRGLGGQIEQLALGAVIALIALKRNSTRINYASPHEMEKITRKAVADFEHSILASYNDLSNIYHIPYQYPELYRFLYEASAQRGQVFP